MHSRIGDLNHSWNCAEDVTFSKVTSSLRFISDAEVCISGEQNQFLPSSKPNSNLWKGSEPWQLPANASHLLSLLEMDAWGRSGLTLFCPSFFHLLHGASTKCKASPKDMFTIITHLHPIVASPVSSSLHQRLPWGLAVLARVFYRSGWITYWQWGLSVTLERFWNLLEMLHFRHHQVRNNEDTDQQVVF